MPIWLNLPKEEAGKSDNQAYWVDHSASVVLVNPDGLIEATFKPEQNKSGIPFINSELMLKDYQKIVALYQ